MFVSLRTWAYAKWQIKIQKITTFTTLQQLVFESIRLESQNL